MSTLHGRLILSTEGEFGQDPDDLEQDIGSLYILEESPPPPLPTMLPSERKRRALPGEPHRCDERCACPVDGTPLVYWPAGDDHACQDGGCVYAYGMADLELLTYLSPFIRPLPPGEAERRRRLYSCEESGQLTRETIMRALLGEFS
jgi:hypothetical protein